MERGYEWRRVVQFTCEERWRRVSDEERSAMIALFHGALMASSPSVEYCNGERLWSVDEAGAKRLRELFATATNGVALGKIAPAEGNTTLQQVVHRLVPLEGNGDPVSLAMSRIADRYGWDATVERMGKPLFAALKKAFEMEIPVLLQTKAGGWVVGAGFLVEGNVPYVLVIDSATVKPEPRVPEASVEEHDNRMALSPATPGHVKYVVAATKSKYVEDRLLDARRELPEGCRFVPMAGEPFASAYFIHDWSPSVCCKDKIRELVATTKPVQEAPGAMFWPARKPVIQKP